MHVEFDAIDAIEVRQIGLRPWNEFQKDLLNGVSSSVAYFLNAARNKPSKKQDYRRYNKDFRPQHCPIGKAGYPEESRDNKKQASNYNQNGCDHGRAHNLPLRSDYSKISFLLSDRNIE